MLLPNKTISYKESCICKGILILDKLNKSKDLTLIELYKKVSKEFIDISEFIDTIDFLYLTNKILINNERVLIC